MAIIEIQQYEYILNRIHNFFHDNKLTYINEINEKISKEQATKDILQNKKVIRITDKKILFYNNSWEEIISFPECFKEPYENNCFFVERTKETFKKIEKILPIIKIRF